ncbi:hypothetical protein ACLOJK_006782 [Asimina triloba]
MFQRSKLQQGGDDSMGTGNGQRPITATSTMSSGSSYNLRSGQKTIQMGSQHPARSSSNVHGWQHHDDIEDGNGFQRLQASCAAAFFTRASNVHGQDFYIAMDFLKKSSKLQQQVGFVHVGSCIPMHQREQAATQQLAYKQQHLATFSCSRGVNKRSHSTIQNRSQQRLQDWQNFANRNVINVNCILLVHNNKRPKQAASSFSPLITSTAAISQLASYVHAAITSKQYNMVLLAKMADNPIRKSGSSDSSMWRRWQQKAVEGESGGIREWQQKFERKGGGCELIGGQTLQNSVAPECWVHEFLVVF